MSLVTIDPKDAEQPVEVALLRHVGESIKAAKARRKFDSRGGRSTAVVDAEIALLRQVVWQVEILREAHRRRGRVARITPEQAAAFVLLSEELLRDSAP